MVTILEQNTVQNCACWQTHPFTNVISRWYCTAQTMGWADNQ